MDALDPLLHQPLRTQLAAYLAGAGEATFTDLRRQLDVSDGNLDSHLKKLIAADYISVRKESGGVRPQSYYALTVIGQQALRDYVAALQRLLTFDQGAPAANWQATVPT
ncbi:transcriptional regulator [Ferriphaselus sp. R-1]|uniref:transcriptional regulator n=1 Tax=Ferriphaselus sp. R-1 TaxID=1485544 RepID=UPI00068E7A30|nr:transcriptional regulator [Ferriphaselus sp. R-1]